MPGVRPQGGDEGVVETAPSPGLRDAEVAVPERDDSPPAGVVSLGVGGRTLASAAEPGEAPHETVQLERRRLRGTMVGIDEESGAPRVRVSLKELISCRLPSGGEVERERVQYFPPSQIQRVRSSPGARIPARAQRSVPLRLGVGRCPPGAEPQAVVGELWGDVTNGLGLEAVTPHIRLEWRR